MADIKRPAPFPCASCPYRRDVPSGVWSPEEYEKLPRYDNPLPNQPWSAFLCHQGNDRLCSGWVGCHDMDTSLGLRVVLGNGLLSPEDARAAADYECPVPLFESGLDAALHGMAEVTDPSPDARRTIAKLEARRERRGSP